MRTISNLAFFSVKPSQENLTSVFEPLSTMSAQKHFCPTQASTIADDRIFTHQLMQSLEIVRDDLRLWSIYETRLLLLVFVVALLVPGAIRRLVLGSDLAVDLPLHLHEERREHTELGAATRHLQQTQYHMPLVLTHYEILGLEEQTLDDAEAVAAPVDEVRDVVAGEESAGLGVRQVGHVAHLAHRQRQGGYRACHRHFASLTSGHVVCCVFPHVVRMLKAEKNHYFD